MFDEHPGTFLLAVDAARSCGQLAQRSFFEFLRGLVDSIAARFLFTTVQVPVRYDEDYDNQGPLRGFAVALHSLIARSPTRISSFCLRLLATV